MKLIVLISIAIVITASWLYFAATADFAEPALIGLTQSAPAPANSNTATEPTIPNASATPEAPAPAEYVLPLDRPDERITKKPFGIHITPATSPIQPERFSGYHTGSDFEILNGEADIDVMVRAFCRGPILTARTVNGYGGVVIQSCSVAEEPVTALYGHLDLKTVVPSVGDTMNAGDQLAALGDGYSDETDGERKHLHFSLHRGNSLEYRGYVSSEAGLNAWIDPLEVF